MTMTPEMEALKARLKAIGMAGDYGHFAKYLEPGGHGVLPRLIWSAHNQASDGGTEIESEYIEVAAIRA